MISLKQDWDYCLDTSRCLSHKNNFFVWTSKERQNEAGFTLTFLINVGEQAMKKKYIKLTKHVMG